MTTLLKTHFTLADLDKSIVLEPDTNADSAVIWLHGLGADGNDFAGILPQLQLPNNHKVRFIFPHAPIQAVTVNGGMEMRSWYDIYSMTIAEKMDVEGIEQSASIVAEMIEQQIAQGVSADKIVLAGFSQGGLVVLHAGLQSKHPIAGIMALSTYYPEACWQAIENRQVKTNSVPILMAHGLYDQVIPLPVASKAKNLLTSKELNVEWHEYPMEHQVCMEEIEVIANWLKDKLIN